MEWIVQRKENGRFGDFKHSDRKQYAFRINNERQIVGIDEMNPNEVYTGWDSGKRYRKVPADPLLRAIYEAQERP